MCRDVQLGRSCLASPSPHIPWVRAHSLGQRAQDSARSQCLPLLDKGSRAHLIKTTRKSPSSPESGEDGGHLSHTCLNPFFTLSETGQVELRLGRNFLSKRTGLL